MAKEKNPLAEIIDDIAAKRVLAESNPRQRVKVNEEGEQEIEHITNPHVIRQLEAKKRNANDDIKNLFREYRSQVNRSNIFIIAVGSDADKFAEKANADCNTFSYGLKDLYASVIDRVPEILYKNKIADRVLLEHILERFDERATEIGVEAWQRFAFDRKYAKPMKSKQDVVDLMATMFHDHVGTEIIGYDAIHKASEDGLKDGFGGKVVPIILHTTDIDLAVKVCGALTRLSPYVISIKSGDVEGKELTTDFSVDKITKKSVMDTMLKIRKEVL